MKNGLTLVFFSFLFAFPLIQATQSQVPQIQYWSKNSQGIYLLRTNAFFNVAREIEGDLRRGIRNGYSAQRFATHAEQYKSYKYRTKRK